MSPFINNLVVSVITVIYVFAVVAIMDFLVRKGLAQDLSRKMVHIAAASWLLCWYFIDFSHWSQYFNILPAVIWTFLLVTKGFFASPEDDAVRTMTRTGDRKELLRGPLYFTIVMCLMGTYFLNTEYALITMGILGWGDGLAPVIGTRFGKIKYKVLAEKTLEGSITFLVFGILGAVLFCGLMCGEFSLNKIVIIAAASTLIEAVSPKDLDNLLIPVTTYLIYMIV